MLSPLEQEFGFASGKASNISVCFSAGLTAGAAFWGIMVDIIGRQWAFNLTVLTSSIFGLALGGSNTYTTFLILTAFVGLGIGGNIPIDTTITLEFIPQNRRRLLPFLSVFQPMGVVICAALAYAFIPTYSCTPNFTSANPLISCNDPSVGPGEACCGRANNMGWRYLLFTIGGITLAVFILRFVIFRFQESPKFHVYRGRDDKAIKVLENVRRFNGQECKLTLQMFEDLTNEHDSMSSGAAMLGGGAKQLKKTWTEKVMLELDRYKMLFQPVSTVTSSKKARFGSVSTMWDESRMARLTILVWLTYICDYWGFTLAGFFLPTILAAKNADVAVGLRESYRDYVYIYLPGIVGVLLGVFCYDLPRFGRKWTMVLSSGLMAASLFLFATITTLASNIGISAMEYFFQSMFNAVLYGWTPEVFPAPVRGTACGVASFWGRLAGIVAPLIAAGLVPAQGSPGSAYDSLLYLAGGVTLGCVLWTALLPNKMVGSMSM